MKIVMKGTHIYIHTHKSRRMKRGLAHTRLCKGKAKNRGIFLLKADRLKRRPAKGVYAGISQPALPAHTCSWHLSRQPVIPAVAHGGQTLLVVIGVGRSVGGGGGSKKKNMKQEMERKVKD